MQHKQKEINSFVYKIQYKKISSFVYKTNINKQKQTALFTKLTLTNKKEQLR